MQKWALSEITGFWIIGFMLGLGMPIHVDDEHLQIDIFFGIFAISFYFEITGV